MSRLISRHSVTLDFMIFFDNQATFTQNNLPFEFLDSLLPDFWNMLARMLVAILFIKPVHSPNPSIGNIMTILNVLNECLPMGCQ